ncbi:MAG: hypothetical protein ACFFD3_03165 [Candidatus Thorarchaeota archaeon]
MRYAYGVLIGFLLSGIIFIVAAVIKLAGFGITDQNALSTIWNIFLIWVFVSIILVFAPVVISFFAYRPIFKDIVFFEAGGLALFTPFWFAIAAEISGDSIIDVLMNGVDNAIPFFNETGQLVGVRIGPVMLVPILLLMVVVGLFILRPSFISSLHKTEEPPELSALKESAVDPMEAEMPDIAPPVADSNSIDELRKILTEISLPSSTIELIINAGFATITDLVATSPEQLASSARIESKIAQDILLAVQKRVWFGGI